MSVTTPENVQIIRNSVESSNLKSIGYNAENGLLDVEFAGGDVWRYSGVEVLMYDMLMKSESTGSFFAKNIKPRYAGWLHYSPDADKMAKEMKRRSQAADDEQRNASGI